MNNFHDLGHWKKKEWWWWEGWDDRDRLTDEREKCSIWRKRVVSLCTKLKFFIMLKQSCAELHQKNDWLEDMHVKVSAWKKNKICTFLQQWVSWMSLAYLGSPYQRDYSRSGSKSLLQVNSHCLRMVSAPTNFHSAQTWNACRELHNLFLFFWISKEELNSW